MSLLLWVADYWNKNLSRSVQWNGQCLVLTLKGRSRALLEKKIQVSSRLEARQAMAEKGMRGASW
jgi:hypothetical protein